MSSVAGLSVDLVCSRYSIAWAIWIGTLPDFAASVLIDDDVEWLSHIPGSVGRRDLAPKKWTT